jgi:hypothetical protein
LHLKKNLSARRRQIYWGAHPPKKKTRADQKNVSYKGKYIFSKKNLKINWVKVLKKHSKLSKGK